MSGITAKSFILLALCLYSVSGFHTLSKRQVAADEPTDAVSGAESDVTEAIENVDDVAKEEAQQLPVIPDEPSGLESGVEGDLDNVGEEAKTVTGEVNGISADLVSQLSALQTSISGLQTQLQTLQASLVESVGGVEGDLIGGTESTTGVSTG